MASWRKILCGVDFGEASRLALEEAADLARRFGAELVLAHAFEPPPPMAADALVASPDLVEQTRAELRRKLDGWAAEAGRRAGRPVRSHLASGEPARELVRLAREEGADLVVVGTHGRKGLKHLVLGSVAEKVVRAAPGPVLVVREPGAAG